LIGENNVSRDIRIGLKSWKPEPAVFKLNLLIDGTATLAGLNNMGKGFSL
jgi:hypothetical protein